MRIDEIRASAEKYAARYTDENGRLNLNRLCRGERIRLFTYRQAGKLLKKLNIDMYMKSGDGFAFADMIFFDNTKSPERQRFTVAHELGHIILHSRNYKDRNTAELEADAFAFSLLSPLMNGTNEST